MRRLALLALLAFGCCQPAYAEAPHVPGEPNWRVGVFATATTSVVVDVVDAATGVQVANNVATTRLQVDSTDASVWTLNLAAVPGYPVACERKTWLVRFVPDSANCSNAATPGLCADEIVHLGGYLCESNPSVQVSYVHASSVQAGQGITQGVMDYFGKRAQLPVRWREIRVAADKDFTSPDHTVWEVYFYGEGGNAPHLACTVTTETNPTSSLPSSASCSGAP
jgi:hypothetical protein